MEKQKIIVILGQTASGKSDLAVQIAKKYNGEIISADSRQVYKGLDIGTGKITKKEMVGIKHYCLSYASPKRIHTVSQFIKIAKKALKEISTKNKLPILCGGTGLYIDILLNEINLPEVKPNLKLRRKLEKCDTITLFNKLKILDKQRADTLLKNGGNKNKRRLIRALEIIYDTNKPVTYFKNGIQNSNHNKINYAPLYIGINISENKLKDRIHKRLIQRLRRGLIKEVNELQAQKILSWEKLQSLGLEYKYVALYLSGMINKNELATQLEKEIWRYAKRQMTWFKRNKSINWVGNKNEAYRLVAQFLKK